MDHSMCTRYSYVLRRRCSFRIPTSKKFSSKILFEIFSEVQKEAASMFTMILLIANILLEIARTVYLVSITVHIFFSVRTFRYISRISSSGLGRIFYPPLHIPSALVLLVQAIFGKISTDCLKVGSKPCCTLDGKVALSQLSTYSPYCPP